MGEWFGESPLPGETLIAGQLEPIIGDLAAQAMPGTFRNVVGANGGHEVWQRGTSVAVAANTTAYTDDRWFLQTSASEAYVVSRQAGLTNGSQFCARVLRNATQNTPGQVYFEFPLDTDEVYKLRGNQVIATFTAKTGANWSPSSGTLTCNLYVGTGAVGKRGGTGYAGETNPINFGNNIAAAAGATAYTSSVSTAIATNITQAALQFTWTPTGIAGADDSISIDDVQLQVVTSNLTPIVPIFERTDFKSDYDRCLKHFYKTFAYLTAPAQSAGRTSDIEYIIVVGGAGNPQGTFLRFAFDMRVIPTITFYNPSSANTNWRNFSLGADSGASQANGTSQKGLNLQVTTVTGETAGNVVGVHFTADASI